MNAPSGGRPVLSLELAGFWFAVASASAAGFAWGVRWLAFGGLGVLLGSVAAWGYARLEVSRDAR